MDWRNGLNSVIVSALLLSATNAVADDAGDRTYEVTVTNITKGEIFTPIMVASHAAGVKLFQLGSGASAELAMLAEGGDTGPLSLALEAGGALEVVTAADVLPPGASVTLEVAMNGRNRHVSVAAMLVPTNDGFFAVNGIAGPSGRGSLSVVSPAYDAGTEDNDELCVSIPGPPFVCAGEGYNPAPGEGYVYIHPGIQGGGDLIPSAHDWRNPVAKITIRASRR
ncbi:MAG: spondin domain-containing protein [Gammaproteobacteria bacterium]|nr:MAG: spondin domain-containing protein [Gammaproteobacteria bacterium]